MKKILMFIVLAPVAGLILLMAIGAMLPPPSPEEQKQAAVQRECDKMMSDAAPGPDRQMTRQMCERMGWKE